MSKRGFGKFVVGAGIGALIGILIAPKKGSETREDLKIKTDEFLKKVKSLKKEDIQEEFEIRIEKLKKEIDELDKEKVLNIAKEKAKLVKRETQKLVDLAKEKGTPVLEKTAEDVRLKAIDVTKNVLNKLENADKKAKEDKENK
ncbi:MAG: YtxH domain-containing protein [Bacilli bacterium]|nr:YtxH domain-containing protein [Bacilli bacterium]